MDSVTGIFLYFIGMGAGLLMARFVFGWTHKRPRRLAPVQVVANYAPFQIILQANGVISESEQLAVAQMAVAAMRQK